MVEMKSLMFKKYISMKNIIILHFILVGILAACISPNSKEKNSVERYRPQVHFSPDSMWMNNPNGMVFYKGEYHLFYQYNPDSMKWGNMHWGHAVSDDLIHWAQLPIALYPDSLGNILSGSVVIDWKNTSGLGSELNPPMVAVFTYQNSILEKEGSNQFQTQGIAFSNDSGRTWEKYAQNPVINNFGMKDFRDPKVFWDDETEKWIMVLAVHDHVNIYSSTDLLKWEFESEFTPNFGSFEGIWECPDLFPLTMKNGEDRKWILLVSLRNGAPNGGSGTQYFVGEFNGHYFIPEGNKTKWLDFGSDNYASVSWSDVSEADCRRISIGWMNNWQYAEEIPTTLWRGAMTVPRKLSLTKIYEQTMISSEPIEEFDAAVSEVKKLEPTKVNGEALIENDFETPSVLTLRFNTSKRTALGFPESFGLRLYNDINEQLTIGMDNLNQMIFVDRSLAGWDNESNLFARIHYAPYFYNSDEIELKIIIDRSSVELFTKEGLVVMTEQYYTSEPLNRISIFSKNGEIEVLNGSIKKLISIR